ncbi:MAG: phytoene desaturase [Phycisphaerae bacterium]|nr:phytoene desaturase [Phycisphaerae bacterium]
MIATSPNSDRTGSPRIGIVGAGPGGLASAMLLAHAGAEVVIHEAQPRVGGRTRTLEIGPYRFDTGPTFFMMPWVLEEIFGRCGLRLSDHADLHRLDPMYRLVIGRPEQDPLVIDATQDIDRMAATLDSIEPGDGAAFRRFMTDNRRKLSLMTPILRRPVRSLLDLVKMDAIKVGPSLKPWQSVHGNLSSYFRNDHIRLALSFQSKYLGMSPFECPGLFSILPFIEYEYGVWHPKGGCNALVQAMAEAFEKLGGRIELADPVEEIEFDGRRARGLRTGSGAHAYDEVIVNADATWAMKNLIPANLRRKWSDRKIDTRRYSCSTFMLYLGLEGDVDLPHHTIYTSKTYQDNLEDIGDGRLTEDASTYVHNPSRIDPSMAPEGHSSLYVLVPTPNVGKGDIDWQQEGLKYREATLDRLETVFGIKDVRSRIRAERMITPADWEAERINLGATFNLAHGLDQMLHRRPQHRLEDVDGVWMVGGGTHPGSGLPVIFLSSQITADLVCREHGLRETPAWTPTETVGAS